jgi:hypothetical protein
MRTFLPALLCLCAASPAAAGDADEKRAILAVVQELFDALGAKDEARVMAAVVPEGRISAQRVRDGQVQLRVQSWQEWAKSLPQARETLEERMHGPKVRVKGNIASVWTYYTFWRDGKFSHCGIDNFDMAKVGGRWKILHISFTVETEGCRKR